MCASWHTDRNVRRFRLPRLCGMAELSAGRIEREEDKHDVATDQPTTSREQRQSSLWLCRGAKEAGTIEQINVTSVPKWAFILAKLIPYWWIAMFVFVVCMLLLSGLFTPTRSMPHLAYLTSYVNPMHYFVDGIRTVFVRGGGFHSVAHQLLALLAIASLMGIWAVGSYRKNN